MDEPAPDLLLELYRSAVARANPERLVAGALPEPPAGRTIVLGAGKAAAAMAREIERHWSGPLRGLVIAPYGHGLPLAQIELVEAGHPLPDGAGLAATERLLAMAVGLDAADLALCPISGGASALLVRPAAGIALEDKQRLIAPLLASGAPIEEINCVRKHLSAVKGGRLALACHPARVCTLLISDVPGDDPSVIGSGPTVADPTTLADAQAVLERYAIDAPSQVRRTLASADAETPKPSDPRLAGGDFRILARGADALAAASALAQARGYQVRSLGAAIQGESRRVAAEHAALALEIATGRASPRPPCILLSGGETTVTVTGHGRGGRNTEYLLALAIALDGHPRIYALAADTDGLDGRGGHAGALIGPATLSRAAASGLDPAAALVANDSGGFFAHLGDLIVTGPTRTNVNDFRAILIDVR